MKDIQMKDIQINFESIKRDTISIQMNKVKNLLCTPLRDIQMNKVKNLCVCMCVCMSAGQFAKAFCCCSHLFYCMVLTGCHGDHVTDCIT